MAQSKHKTVSRKGKKTSDKVSRWLATSGAQTGLKKALEQAEKTKSKLEEGRKVEPSLPNIRIAGFQM